MLRGIGTLDYIRKELGWDEVKKIARLIAKNLDKEREGLKEIPASLIEEKIKSALDHCRISFSKLKLKALIVSANRQTFLSERLLVIRQGLENLIEESDIDKLPESLNILAADKEFKEKIGLSELLEAFEETVQTEDLWLRKMFERYITLSPLPEGTAGKIARGFKIWLSS